MKKRISFVVGCGTLVQDYRIYLYVILYPSTNLQGLRPKSCAWLLSQMRWGRSAKSNKPGPIGKYDVVQNIHAK